MIKTNRTSFSSTYDQQLPYYQKRTFMDAIIFDCLLNCQMRISNPMVNSKINTNLNHKISLKDIASSSLSQEINLTSKEQQPQPKLVDTPQQEKERCPSPLSPSSQILTTYINCVLEPTADLGGIYISDYDYAANISNLEDNKITSVLSIDRNYNFKLPEKFNHKTIVVFDNEMESIKVHFDKTYQFILNAIQNKQNILIHCRRGISRSATIIIAFMMKFQNKSYEDSFNYLKEKRPIINPNAGFVKQLKNYEVVLREYSFYKNQQK